MFTNILLCTHGSKGAQKAEKYVFENILPHTEAIAVTVLTIIDKDWSVMTGDDWLNTSGTRNRFMDYVDEQLGREINEDWQRIRSTYALPDSVRFMKVAGGLEETIIHVAEELNNDVVVIGGFYQKPRRLTSVTMSPGLAATLSKKKLHPHLPCPLLTITC